MIGRYGQMRNMITSNVQRRNGGGGGWVHKVEEGRRMEERANRETEER